MANVRFQRPLRLPPVLAFDALLEVLLAIARGDSGWQGFALHVRLGDLHVPDVGEVRIPIALTVGARQAETQAIELSFRATAHAQAFPTYLGSIGVDGLGPTGSILWLEGNYDVPLRLFGKLVDATIASGIASRTLENLVDDLAAACTARVEKREAAFARYIYHNVHA